jgi:hypothetical protein
MSQYITEESHVEKLSKPIAGKALIWIGLCMFVAATLVYNLGNQESLLVLGTSFVGFPLGLLLLGFGIGQLYLEPVGQKIDVTLLSQSNPIRIPDNNVRRTNLVLALWMTPIFIFAVYIAFSFWLVAVMILVAEAILLFLIFTIRSRSYMVYSDRFELHINFPKKVTTIIYFKDIAVIQKTRKIPFGMWPMFSFKVRYIALIASFESWVISGITKDYLGVAIGIMTNAKDVYLLPNCLFADDTVQKLARIIAIKNTKQT